MKKGEGIYKEKEGITENRERAYTPRRREYLMGNGEDIHGEDMQKNTYISNQSTSQFILFSDKLLWNIIYRDKLYPI